MPQAEFISAEEVKKGFPSWGTQLGSYGGPAKESVEKQIALIEEFVEKRR